MTLSVFKAEVKGPNTLSSFLKSFLKRVSLGNSPLVILINGKDLSSFNRILYRGENFFINKSTFMMSLFWPRVRKKNKYLT